jgi:hypothetical protein
MDVAWSSPLSPQEMLREVAHHINRALEGVSDGQFENVQKRTGETDQ